MLALGCAPISRCLTIRSAALACLVFASARTATGQDTTRALTDEGLRQLAEVVDGVRTGGLVWVVLCGASAPFEVLGTYPSLAAAQAAVARSRRRDCSIHGPSVSIADASTGFVAYGEACRKRDDSSCAPADTMMFTISDVEAVTVTIRGRGGRTSTSTFRPSDGEAIFFTMAAVDKLLIPYYQRVYGLDYAQRERARLLRVLYPGR